VLLALDATVTCLARGRAHAPARRLPPRAGPDRPAVRRAPHRNPFPRAARAVRHAFLKGGRPRPWRSRSSACRAAHARRGRRALPRRAYRARRRRPDDVARAAAERALEGRAPTPGALREAGGSPGPSAGRSATSAPRRATAPAVEAWCPRAYALASSASGRGRRDEDRRSTSRSKRRAPRRADRAAPDALTCSRHLGLTARKQNCLERNAASARLSGPRGERLHPPRRPVPGRDVLTIEGLARDGRLHPLQTGLHRPRRRAVRLLASRP